MDLLAPRDIVHSMQVDSRKLLASKSRKKNLASKKYLMSLFQEPLMLVSSFGIKNFDQYLAYQQVMNHFSTDE